MATLCTSCRLPIEPDDGGGLWYHVDNMSMMCDGDDSTDISRQASPPDDVPDFEEIADTLGAHVVALVDSIGGDPTVTYGLTGNGDPTAHLLTGDGVLIAVDESGAVTSTLLIDQPWQSGIVTAHAGEDGDDLPPAPELDALERIRDAIDHTGDYISTARVRAILESIGR